MFGLKHEDIMALHNCELFKNIDLQGMEQCISCAGGKVVNLPRNQYLFHQGEVPKYLFILISGGIAITSNTLAGEEQITAIFTQGGTIFGEVFLFLKDTNYKQGVKAIKDSLVLQIPKDFLYKICGQACDHHQLMINNMLSILAEKTYFLNQRVQILNGCNLQQKIARSLLMDHKDLNIATMNREQLANFINTTRPSLSRELMKMQEQGLIIIENKRIIIKDRHKLQELA